MPYQTFPFKGFGGGLNLRDGIDVVEETQAIDLLNVLFSTRGTVTQRSGYGKLTSIPGTNRYDSLAAFYKTDGTKQIVAGAGNRLEAISAVGTIIASLTAGVTAGPHFFQRFGGPTGEHIYIANGTDTVRRWTGTAFETPVYTGTTPRGKFLGLSVTDNRLVNAWFTGAVAGNNPSTVRFSNEGDPLTFGDTNYVDLTPGDGEEIMGVATWRDLIFVFKQTKFFVFYGTTPDDDGDPEFLYRPVDAGVGLVSSKALAVAEQGVYFLDRTGVYFSAQAQPERVSDSVEPIFHGGSSVYYTGGELNDAAIDQTTMTYHDERLWLSFPGGVSPINNRQLVFDPHNNWWTLYDLPAGPMINFRPASVDELIFGYSSGAQHLGRHVQGTASFPADDMGESYINLIPNPSGEAGVPTVQSTSGSSVGQPAASVVDSTAWARFGTHASRFTVSRDDGASLVARTATGVGGVPITGGHYYAFRVTANEQSTTGTIRNLRARFQWYKADGSATTPATSDGPVTTSPILGQPNDLYVIAQAPSDAAFMAGGIFLGSTTAVAMTHVVDLDAFMLVDLGTTFTGGTLAATQAADVPAYFDGSVRGTWLGAANASQSLLFEPAIGGNAITSYWQSGWFNYGTAAVKTIRESRISGSGLVTVQYFHDYRQSPSQSQQVELSPPVGFYDTGSLYDSGLSYGPSGIIQPKPIRKATRGEAFSIRLFNSTLNRSFQVHRFTNHLREVRVPSVVKVT